MKKFVAVTLFFFCIIAFSAAPPASAHDGVTAKAASGGDEKDVRNFLLHLKRHRARLSGDDERIQFRNALRNNNGVWRHGDMYVITVNKPGSGGGGAASVQAGDIVFFHGKYPRALSGSLRDIPIFRNLIDRVQGGADDEVVCVQDSSGKYGNHICAVEDSDTTGSGTVNSFIQVAGFNHERGDVDHSKAIEACPEFTSDELQSKGWLSADMVDDEESLVRYLKGVEAHISEEFAAVSGQQSGGNAQGELPLMRMIQLMPCWRMWPWQSGSIYFYMIIYTDKQYGIFNGLTPQFQDTSLLLIDENNLNVGQEVRDIVEQQDDGFLTYLWDDPVVSGDEVVCEETGFVSGAPLENEGEGENEDREVFCEAGSPIPGKSPGTSVKRGYFIKTNFGLGETDYVLGSGIYPKSKERGSSGGGGGCAIASGSGNESEAAAFSLFLVAAALFLVTSGKNRPGEKLLTRGLRALRKSGRR